MSRSALLVLVACACAVACVTCAGVSAAQAQAPSQPAPEQVHLSYTANDGEMWVSWVTVGTRGLTTTAPGCTYGPPWNPTQFSAAASTATYVDGVCHRPECVAWNGTVFSARLTELRGGEQYTYVCGAVETGYAPDPAGWFYARPLSGDADQPLVFGVVGDIGADAIARRVRDDILQYVRENGGSARGVDPSAMSFFLAVGDIAYANGNQSVWDDFGRLWEPFTQAVPVLLSPGNHDGGWVYGNNVQLPWGPTGGGETGVSYSTRYPGPGPVVSFDDPYTGVMNSTSYWWSADVNRVHVVTLSTVHAFLPGSDQYAWLQADLELANTPESRAQRPWLIVTSHYPLYCTLGDCFCNYTAGSDCEQSQRVPVPGVYQVTARMVKEALEPLLLQYGVDLVITGHEHCYERTYPVADFVVTDWDEHTYVSPKAPVHVMVGTGGSSPDVDFKPRSAQIAWSAARSDRDGPLNPYGWARVSNPTRDTLNVQYYNSRSNGVDGGEYLYDEFSIIKPDA